MAAKIARSKACVMKWRQKEKKLRRAVRGAEADFYITLASTSRETDPHQEYSKQAHNTQKQS
jgi:hypothetical protein